MKFFANRIQEELYNIINEKPGIAQSDLMRLMIEKGFYSDNILSTRVSISTSLKKMKYANLITNATLLPDSTGGIRKNVWSIVK